MDSLLIAGVGRQVVHTELMVPQVIELFPTSPLLLKLIKILFPFAPPTRVFFLHNLSPGRVFF